MYFKLPIHIIKRFSFALLYTELEDHSQAFINFMEAISNSEVNGLDCEDLFWKCSTDDEYMSLSGFQ